MGPEHTSASPVLSPKYGTSADKKTGSERFFDSTHTKRLMPMISPLIQFFRVATRVREGSFAPAAARGGNRGKRGFSQMGGGATTSSEVVM